MGNQAGDDKSVTRRLLRCKIDTLVSTFSIHSFNFNENIGELTALAEGKGVFLVCLQEHWKFHDSGDVQYTDVGKGWILATSSCWRNSVNSYVGEVGMLLSPSAYNYLEDNVVVVNSRILVADLSGNPATTIICCYSSTNCSDDNDTVDFYNTFSEVIKKLLGYKIIYGDMNAQISPLNFGGFSFGKKTHRIGQFMLDMATACELIICDTRFQKRNGKS